MLPLPTHGARDPRSLWRGYVENIPVGRPVGPATVNIGILFPRDAYENLMARLNKASGLAQDGSAAKLLEHLQYLTEYERGRKPYALAGKKALKDTAVKLKPILHVLNKLRQPMRSKVPWAKTLWR